MRPELKKRLFLIFKAIVIICSYGYVAYRLYFDEQLRNTLFNGNLETQNYLWLILAIALMPLNWGIETLKWKYLLRFTERVSFISAFASVFAGISVAVFTPNRTGEYFGRIWILRQRNRIAGVSLSIAGSFAQTAITLFAGTIAGWYWISVNYESQLTSQQQVVFATIIVIIGVLFYLNIPFVAKKATKYWKNKYFLQFVGGLQKLNPRILSSALAISALRYFTFTLQFILLLIYFDAGLTLIEASLSIALLYSAMLLIPTITVAEPGIRSSLSLIIFGVFSTNEAGILSASLTLWLINLAAPALIGALVLAAQKLDKND